MTPEFHTPKEAPVRCCWTRHRVFWLPLKCTPTSKAWQLFHNFFPHNLANLILSCSGQVKTTGNCSYIFFPFLPWPFQLHAALQGIPDRILSGLESPLQSKTDSRKADLHVIQKYECQLSPSFQLRLIKLITNAALLLYIYTHFKTIGVV